LVIGNNTTLRGARRNVLAGGTIGHLIYDLDIGFSGGNEMELAEGEGLIATGSDLKVRVGLLGELSLDAFAL
jgi:hypothetical protein